MESEDDDSQKNILRMTEAQTVQIVKLYREEQCLWDTLHPHYKFKTAREESQDRIAKKLNLEKFKGTHVSIKCKNLRNAYLKELKKIAVSKQKAKGKRAAVYKPLVKWFDVMDSFLRPHLLHPADWRMPELLKASSTKPHRQQKASESPDSETDHDDDTNGLLRRTNRKRSQPSSNKTKTCNVPGDEPVKLLDAMKDLTEELKSSREITDNGDTFDCFGKYMASILRVMPPEESRDLQPKILSFIMSEAASRSARRGVKDVVSEEIVIL